MRIATVAAIVLAGAFHALPLVAQGPGSVIRRPQPKAFPFSVTPSAGVGFGSTRATAFEPATCPSADHCLTLGAGSGWNVGVELQVPLGQTLGFEVAGQVAHPNQRVCFRAQCQSPRDVWAGRGTAMLLWRFKPRAPIYFGLGGGITHFPVSPVAGQSLTAEGEGPVTEYGVATVIGYDFAFTPRLGGRVTWRAYFMVPTASGLPGNYTATGLAFDNTFAFGVRFLLGS